MFQPNPFDIWRASLEAARIAAESHLVIGLRLAGLAGFWPMDPSEAARMVSEKLAASRRAGEAALSVGLAGGSLAQVALAAMHPVGCKTRANARRLIRTVANR